MSSTQETITARAEWRDIQATADELGYGELADGLSPPPYAQAKRIRRHVERLREMLRALGVEA